MKKNEEIPDWYVKQRIVGNIKGPERKEALKRITTEDIEMARNAIIVSRAKSGKVKEKQTLKKLATEVEYEQLAAMTCGSLSETIKNVELKKKRIKEHLNEISKILSTI